MIRKIKKIKLFQTFRNFSWPSALPEFKNYNLIYGGNGTGKTALSRIFRYAEKRDNTEIAFEIECESTIIRSSELSNAPSLPQIRVFNEDFITENVFTTSGNVTPIYYLGEQSISKKKEIEVLRQQRDVFLRNQETIRKELEEKEREQEESCVNQARFIKSLLSAGGALRYINYDKAKYKNKCDQLEREDYKAKILAPSNEETLNRKKDSMPKARLGVVSLTLLSITGIISDVSVILRETVVSKVIERFREDSVINEWARKGYEIHRDKSSNTCFFCGSKLPADFLLLLKDHFSNEYEKFITRIMSLVDEIQGQINSMASLELPDKARFYDELSDSYEMGKLELESEINEYNALLSNLIEKLEQKKANPFLVMELNINLPKSEIQDAIEKLDSYIISHNDKTDNFEREIDETRTTLEESHAAKELEPYIQRKMQIGDLNGRISDLESQINGVNSNLELLETEISEHRRPFEEMNEDLFSYLGHKEIEFCFEDSGYCIKRNGEKAEALSEGEKTAVAFTYFIKTLKDKEFNLNEGIVVIDDPVSSLDSNAIFHAFAFMKTNTSDALQLFILTHNFTFFRQVKNWFVYVNRRKNKLGKTADFYMLKCIMSAGQRIAEFQKLDRLLEDYESEYHYLFSQVYEYSQKSDKDLEAYYHLPNISRRLLETFLAFRIPKETGSLYGALELLKFDESKKTRIKRFVDTHSHNDHIEDSPDHDISILCETPDVLKDIMELIKSEDERHYTQMLEIIVNRNT